MITNLKQQSYGYIREKIISGAWTSGQKLSALAIAREIGISNMPVREALNQLEAEGLVDRIAFSGHVVRQQLSSSEIDELYEYRALLEGYAAAAVATNQPKITLAEMEECCDGMEAISEQATTQQTSSKQTTAQQTTTKQLIKSIDNQAEDLSRELLALDLKFHESMATGCGNRWVSEGLAKLGVLRTAFLSRTVPIPNLHEYASFLVQVHRDLLAILREGDPQQASEAFRKQIQVGRQNREKLETSGIEKPEKNTSSK